ncbi:hypothetical protein NC652_037403 [Populus alba x Populus x berolinensis]|nr:hypothetical protein NC652_037403 [Populus alba x Populus x berolinensis]
MGMPDLREDCPWSMTRDGNASSTSSSSAKTFSLSNLHHSEQPSLSPSSSSSTTTMDSKSSGRFVLTNKDPNKVVSLSWAAINAGDRVNSSLKDMAVVMKQLDGADEAIELIKSFRHLYPMILGNLLRMC